MQHPAGPMARRSDLITEVSSVGQTSDLITEVGSVRQSSDLISEEDCPTEADPKSTLSGVVKRLSSPKRTCIITLQNISKGFHLGSRRQPPTAHVHWGLLVTGPDTKYCPPGQQEVVFAYNGDTHNARFNGTDGFVRWPVIPEDRACSSALYVYWNIPGPEMRLPDAGFLTNSLTVGARAYQFIGQLLRMQGVNTDVTPLWNVAVLMRNLDDAEALEYLWRTSAKHRPHQDGVTNRFVVERPGRRYRVQTRMERVQSDGVAVVFALSVAFNVDTFNVEAFLPD